MAHPFDQPTDGNPTAAEIFHVFRDTTMASLEGLRLLLQECADLRTELVTIHAARHDNDDHGAFSARQQGRILLLQEASKDMEALQASLQNGGSGVEDGTSEQY